MKILYLARWFPFPADNGAKIRTAALLRALAERHSVELISFADHEPSSNDLADAHSVCARVTTVPYAPFQPGSRRARMAFLSPLPRSVASTHSQPFASAVGTAVAESAPDVVIAGQIDMVPYARQIPGVPRILEELELGLRFTAGANTSSSWMRSLSLAKQRRYVRGFLRDFAACTVVSASEESLLHKIAPGYAGRVVVTPNGVSLGPATQSGPPVPDRLLYPGAVTYDANLDAVRYFADEILPLIQAERPGVVLRVTGRTDGVALGNLAQNVEFTGYLSAVEPLLRASWAVVVPLRQGGGTRLKILEALATGTPVVSTSKGAEGLDLASGRDLLIADGPAAFASETLRLLGNPELRASLASAGRVAVERFDWARIGPAFCSMVESIALNQPVPTSSRPLEAVKA